MAMTSAEDILKYLLGKIEATEMLCGAVAADVSRPLLVQAIARCKAIQDKGQSEPLSPFEQGYGSAYSNFLKSLETVAAAEKVRNLDTSNPQ